MAKLCRHRGAQVRSRYFREVEALALAVPVPQKLAELTVSDGEQKRAKVPMPAKTR